MKDNEKKMTLDHYHGGIWNIKICIIRVYEYCI
jgi:hypothetical protein